MIPGFTVTEEMAERARRAAKSIMDRVSIMVGLVLGSDYECILVVVKKDDPVSLGVLATFEDRSVLLTTLENAISRTKANDFHDISGKDHEVH